MEEVGSYQLIARHIQEIQMRLKEESRGYLEDHKHLFPAMANQVGDIYRIGVVPLFSKIGAHSREKGLPRKRARSLPILKSLWKDIRTCKAFALDTDRIPAGERVEFSPTHTVLKRKPDRSFSEEFRTISDLRRINLWLDKKDTFPVWVPGIPLIIERIMMLKNRYTGMKIRIDKRDISQAFRRVAIHPDCSRIFAHSFLKDDTGSKYNCSVGFLSLPFGFLASPSFSLRLQQRFKKYIKAYR